LRSALEKWLATLDPDEAALASAERGLRGLPEFLYQHDGWDLVFFAIPKSQEGRGKPGVRPIGVRFGEPGYVSPHLKPREAVIEKAGRYGDLSAPYIVAVNVLDGHFQRREAVEVLFGTEQVIVSFKEDGDTETRPTRAPDGVWTEGRRNGRSGVSGVLFTHSVSPWGLAKAEVCLYMNPRALRPCPADLLTLPHAEIRDEEIAWKEGRSLGRLLGLAEGWPHH
jgi:hypothetical protein